MSDIYIDIEYGLVPTGIQVSATLGTKTATKVAVFPVTNSNINAARDKAVAAVKLL